METIAGNQTCISLIVFPEDVSCRIVRPVISHLIIADITFLSEVTSCNLIPGIVGLAISVFVLHHINDSWLRKGRIGIAINDHVIAFAVLHGMIKAHYYITAPCTQGYQALLAENALCTRQVARRL